MIKTEDYKKYKLMLMRRARAYNSSSSQIILVYLHPFRCNSLFCSQNLLSRSIKVINVDNLKKLVASACYVKHHVYAYLQQFSR